MQTSKEQNKKQISGVIFFIIILSISLCGLFTYNFYDKDSSKNAYLGTVNVAEANETEKKSETPSKSTEKKKSKTPKNDVTVYVTSWCHYCKITIDYLKKHNIPFIVKDVEKNSDYREEMMTKARICRGGVPVLEVNGKIHCGFNPDVLKKLAQ